MPYKKLRLALPTRGAGAKRGTPRNVERARKGTYLPGRRSGNQRWAGRAPAAAEGCERRLSTQLLLEGRLPGWGGGRAAGAGGLAPSPETAGGRLGSVQRLGSARRQDGASGAARRGAGGALAQFGVSGTLSTPPLPGPRPGSPEVTSFPSEIFRRCHRGWWIWGWREPAELRW